MARILIIEDEEMLAEMYAERFAQEGFDVVVAGSAEEGIEKTKSEKPDLVLLDILLPMNDGIAYLKEKNKNKNLKEIPVVAFSNFDDPETKKEAFQSGALNYLLKTDYTPQEIVAAVKYYLKLPPLKI